MESKRPAGSTTQRPSARESNNVPRILVVDDEPDVRLLNVEVLTLAGYQVDVATDGAIAWETLNSRHYDLLITDNKMPKVTGLELVEKVRLAQLKLPIIMATGTLPTEELARKPWLMPDAVLLKPYSVQEMVAKAGEILSLIRKKERKRPDPQPNWQSLPSDFERSS